MKQATHIEKNFSFPPLSLRISSGSHTFDLFPALAVYSVLSFADLFLSSETNPRGNGRGTVCKHIIYYSEWYVGETSPCLLFYKVSQYPYVPSSSEIDRILYLFYRTTRMFYYYLNLDKKFYSTLANPWRSLKSETIFAFEAGAKRFARANGRLNTSSSGK